MNSQKAVLLVDFTSSFGGAFEQAVQLLNQLHNLGQFRLGLVTRQSRAATDRLPSAVRVFPLNETPRLEKRALPHPHGLRHLSDWLFTEFPRVVRLSLIARRFGADVICLNNLLNAQQSGAIAAKLVGAKCVSVHRDFEYASKTVRWVARLVDVHVAISSAVSVNVQTALRVPAEHVRVIHDGIDLERFSPSSHRALDLSAEFGIKAGSRVFALFGRLVPWKGHDVFLRAARVVFEKIENTHALIVGDASDGEPGYETYLKLLARELGIENRVTFTGYRSDTPELICAADLVTHFSTRPEPSGLVIIEAMACMKPVVAMAAAGPQEIVLDGQSGFLVPPGDPMVAAAAICELLEDVVQSNEMGRAGRARAEQEFSSERCAEEYSTLFRRLCGGGKDLDAEHS